MMAGFVRSTGLFAVLLLSGCSVFSPVQEQQNQFVVGQVPQIKPSHKEKNTRLLISRPVAGPMVDTTQMAYSPRKWEVAYFAKNRWGARPSEMVQDLLVQTFQATHAFSAVSKTALAGRQDMMLNSEIIRFWEDLTGPRPVFQFDLRVEILQGDQTLCSREFSATRRLSEQSPYAVVVAANQAVASVLQRAEIFCMRKIKNKGNTQ